MPEIGFIHFRQSQFVHECVEVSGKSAPGFYILPTTTIDAPNFRGFCKRSIFFDEEATTGSLAYIDGFPNNKYWYYPIGMFQMKYNGFPSEKYGSNINTSILWAKVFPVALQTVHIYDSCRYLHIFPVFVFIFMLNS